MDEYEVIRTKFSWTDVDADAFLLPAHWDLAKIDALMASLYIGNYFINNRLGEDMRWFVYVLV